VTCWVSLDLDNLTLRSETLYQMFSSLWDFEGVCASCAESAHSFILCLNLSKNSVCTLYFMLDSNTLILKLWGVCHTQSCDSPRDPSRGLEVI
jgi:hypothetical protein